MKWFHWILALGLAVTPSLPAYSQSDQILPISVGKSQVVTVGGDVTKVSVTDPTIADVTALSKRDVLINGKKPGTTSMIVWTHNKRLTFDVVVRVDSGLLKATIQKATGAKDLQVEVVNDAVLLYGKVDRTSQVQMAEKIASGFAPRVVNLLAANSIQQVQVNVEVVEMDKNAGSELGIKWGQMTRTSNGEDNFDADHLGAIQSDPRNPRNGQAWSASLPLGTTAFGLYERIAARLNLLVQNGTAKVLAKPNLVAVSGGKAHFLVGGQIPVPIAQQQNQVTFEWKSYGIKLDIEPTVLEDGRIQMRVAPEVSQLDYNNAVRVANFVVPAVTSRQAETQVILGQNQGIAIGGLMQNTESKNVEQLPLLGSIPILGELFKSTKYQHNETELTILVTPHLVGS